MNKLITEIAEKYGDYFNAHADRQMLEQALQEYHDRLVEEALSGQFSERELVGKWLKQQRGE